MRVLVCTIPEWGQRSASDTFSTLFQGFSGQVSNLYMKAGLPDSQSCSNYFHIIESNVLKSIITKSVETGFVVNESKSQEKCLHHEQKRYAFFSKFRWTIFLLLREIAWKLGKWRSPSLDKWLGDVNPDVLVFPIESYIYFNRVCNYIIDTYKPKRVVGFLWDDNFTYKQYPYNPMALIHRWFVRRSVKSLAAKCDQILSISPKMKEECDREFGVNSIIITKPKKEVLYRPYELTTKPPIRLVYAGSLLIGRYNTIKTLVQTIDKVNHERGTNFFLDIYSATPLTKLQERKLNKVGVACFNGQVIQQEVVEILKKSDVLVFAEKLKNTFSNPARLSFSAKVTDYLSAGRTIMAVGPEDSPAIDYFQKEDAALVCINKSDIERNLLAIWENPEILLEKSKRAILVADANHSPEEIRQRFWNVLKINEKNLCSNDD